MDTGPGLVVLLWFCKRAPSSARIRRIVGRFFLSRSLNLAKWSIDLVVAIVGGFIGQRFERCQQRDACLDFGGELRSDRAGLCNFDDATLAVQP